MTTQPKNASLLELGARLVTLRFVAKRFVALFFVAGYLALVSTQLLYAEPPASKTALAAAEELFEAFNQHDPMAMANLVTSDFELYYVDAEGAAELSLRAPRRSPPR